MLRNKVSAAIFITLVLPFVLCAEKKSVQFTILSFNDVYEIVPDAAGRGGFASMQTLLNEQRKLSDHHITTVNGDFLSPCILSIFDRGAHRIDLFNQLGVDLVVLGNHEFDFGPDVVKDRIKESNFLWLTANAFGLDGSPFTGNTQTFIADVEGVKVGFFGLITPETPELSSTEKKVCFSPLTYTARHMVEKLKEQGVDVIVALTHLLFSEDQQLAKEVPEIDVILGGHDHDPITWYDDRTFIHKSGQNAYYLARIDLFIEKDTETNKVMVFPSWNLLLNKNVKPEPIVGASVAKYIEQLDRFTSEELAITKVPMDSLYSNTRTKETVLGNLIADAVRIACDAEVAIISSGIIRGNKYYRKDAPITMKNLYEEMPFGNVNVAVEISGDAIWRALENGLSQYEGKAGRFPQVSGICYIFDDTRPAGARLISVEVAGAPIDKNRLYKVATVDYMYHGGDGYSMLKDGKVLISPLREMTTIASVAELLKSMQIVERGLEGRISKLSFMPTLDELIGLP
jgi:5'-nucleotidase/UDP-sugar diphosphatase